MTVEIIFGLIGVLFTTLSSQYIFGGDSAEFSTIAHTWSVPHPPGYPLYSLIANLLTHIIPFGTIPWRTSLLSAIPAVATSYIIYKILTHIKVRASVSFIAALFYLVLFPVLEYALVPEVFALNSLLVIWITYLLLLFEKHKKVSYVWFAAFLVGLCVTHHHTFIIYIPGWYFLIKNTWTSKKRTKLLPLFLAFLLGTLFYLYAPIASYFNPPIQWEDAKTLEGFWRLITRAAYGTFKAYGGSQFNLKNQLYDVFSMCVLIFQDFRILGVGGILVGVVATLKKKGAFAIFLGITSIVYIFFLFYTNFILTASFTVGMYERFLISFYCILIIYLGIGYNEIVSYILNEIRKRTKKKNLKLFSHLLLILILTATTIIIAYTNYASLGYIRNGQDFDRLGRDIVNTVPSEGIFFVGTDNANFTTKYQLYVNKLNRSSILFQINLMHDKNYMKQFREKNNHLKFPRSFSSNADLQRFFSLNKKRGIFLDAPMPFGMWMPYGLLWKYYDTKEEGIADLSNIVKTNMRLWNQVYHIPSLNKATRNILHLQTIQDLYVEAYISYSKLLYLSGKYSEAQGVLEKIIKQYRPSDTLLKTSLQNLIRLNKNK
jgi:hypothetical protein